MDLPRGQAAKIGQTQNHDYRSHSSLLYGFHQSGYQATLPE